MTSDLEKRQIKDYILDEVDEEEILNYIEHIHTKYSKKSGTNNLDYNKPTKLDEFSERDETTYPDKSSKNVKKTQEDVLNLDDHDTKSESKKGKKSHMEMNRHLKKLELKIKHYRKKSEEVAYQISNIETKNKVLISKLNVLASNNHI